jgi:hypothetical protein
MYIYTIMYKNTQLLEAVHFPVKKFLGQQGGIGGGGAMEGLGRSIEMAKPYAKGVGFCLGQA